MIAERPPSIINRFRDRWHEPVKAEVTIDYSPSRLLGGNVVVVYELVADDSLSTRPSHHVDTEANELLTLTYQLVKMGEDRRAIDAVFAFFTTAFKASAGGPYHVCDRVLELADVCRLNSTLMVAFLSITLPVKGQLISRADYYRRVRMALLHDRGPERTARLLDKYR